MSVVPLKGASAEAAKPSPAIKSPPAISLQMSGSSWLSLLFLSTLWGGSFFFMKIILTEVPPFTLVCMRLSLAALAIVIYARFSGIALRFEPKLWPLFLGIGLMNNVMPFSLLTIGQTLMPHGLSASLASILNATTPMFGIVLAHFLTRDEKMIMRRALGMVIGFCGVGVIMLPSITRYFAFSDHAKNFDDFWALIGMGACILASFIYGFGALLSRKAQLFGLSPLQATSGQLVFAAIFAMPACLILDQPWHLAWPSLPAVASLVTLALVSTDYAYILYYKIIVRTGATNIMLVTLLVPVTTIILTAVFLGERLYLEHFMGMALIAFGLALIDGRIVMILKRKLQQI